jgi:hypothetical protein
MERRKGGRLRTPPGWLCILALGWSACTRQVPAADSEPPRLSAEEVAQLLPRSVPDREGWAQDVVTALQAHGLRPHVSAVCSVLAVIEQESGYKADPPVANLSRLVREKLDAYAEKLGPLGPPAMRELLDRKAPGEKRTFAERLERVKTEQELDRVFRELLAYYRTEFPATFAAANLLGRLFTHASLEDFNPITTAGSMQVSVRFATELAEEKGREPEKVRDELYTRYGGVYYGTARLLGYPASYAEPIFRFADYNAGQYSSRNAALQEQLSRLTGRQLVLDGDMLAYDKKGEPVSTDSRTLEALLAFRERHAPSLSERQVRREVRKEKTLEFEETDTYRALRRVYEEVHGEPPAYARLPNVPIRSPKMAKERTTAWFARSVDGRYRKCLERHAGTPGATR